MMQLKPDSKPTHYQTYVLSLWRETSNTPWRAALRSAENQERVGFADLETLALFLLRLGDDHHSDNNENHAAHVQSGDSL